MSANDVGGAREETAVVEAIRDQWLIAVAVVVLVLGVVAWRWSGR